MSLKFQNSKSDISCKIEFHIFFIINCKSLELRGQWGTIKSGWIRLYSSIFKKTKTIHKTASRNSTISVLIKSVCASCISPSSTKLFPSNQPHVDGSLVKSRTLSENTSGICQTYCCYFFSMTAIFDTAFCILW